MSSKVEQLEVQLAGCGVAALGHIQEPAKPGDYGWSPSYEDVLRLRKRFNLLYDTINDSRKSKEPSDQALLKILRAWHEVHEDMRNPSLEGLQRRPSSKID